MDYEYEKVARHAALNYCAELLQQQVKKFEGAGEKRIVCEVLSYQQVICRMRDEIFKA